jgi:predicted MPP superfamily phosphohydrolase
MSVYEWPAAVAAALGGAAVVLDLGSRLLGSYRRTLWGASCRVLLVAAAGGVLFVPLCVASAGLPLAGAPSCLAALVGVAMVVHLFLPRRHGVRRLSPPDCVEVARPLLPRTSFVRCSLTLESLPDELDGLRLLVISDIHCNNASTLDRLRRSLDAAAACEPDLALMLGDFGEKASLLPAAVAALTSVHARLGTFCVRGNHDFEGGRARLLADLLAETPIHLLDNRTWSGGGLTLVGVEAPWNAATPATGPQDGFRIALSHTPDNVFALERGGMDLVVAGHTHGGLLKFPHLGPLLVASRYGALLARGGFRLRRTTLYVTPGFRYFPASYWGGGELAELTLRI